MIIGKQKKKKKIGKIVNQMKCGWNHFIRSDTFDESNLCPENEYLIGFYFSEIFHQILPPLNGVCVCELCGAIMSINK